MTIVNMAALRAGLKPGQRLIGLDFGSKRIGVALSDVGLRIASPFGTIKRSKLAANAAEIAEIARVHSVGGLVVGLPLSMDGSLGPAAQATRDWTHAISAATCLPATLWDERLSSSAVNRMLIQDADVRRGVRNEIADKLSAAYMLQIFLG